MQLSALDDLSKRISPRLSKFHSVDQSNEAVTGVNYWKSGYLYQDYCEAQNGYVCQRSAAAGSAPDRNGKKME